MNVLAPGQTSPVVFTDSLRLRAVRGGPVEVRANEADCLRCVANGVNFSIRDDDPDSVSRIQRKLASLEPWTANAKPIVDFGVVEPLTNPVCGAALLALHEQFDFLNDASDCAAYRALILGEGARVSDMLERKIREYRRRDGAVLYAKGNLDAEQLRTLVPKPAVIAPNLPAEAEVTYLEQRLPGGIRRVAHVLYFPDGKPGVLENVQLSVRLPQHPLGVVTVPDLKPLEFVHNEFLTTFTLARLAGHQAIAFE